MQNELPEWAKTIGTEIANQQWLNTFEKSELANSIARALVAAERRGIERAAEAAAKIGRPAGARDTYIPGTSADAVRAIRQLGEEP